MKQTPLRRVSKKQSKELAVRTSLKRELLDECDHTCMTCNNLRLDFRGLSLSHVIALGSGGKTARDNCLIECYPCHDDYEKHAERRPEWQKAKFNIV